MFNLESSIRNELASLAGSVAEEPVEMCSYMLG